MLNIRKKRRFIFGKTSEIKIKMRKEEKNGKDCVVIRIQG